MTDYGLSLIADAINTLAAVLAIMFVALNFMCMGVIAAINNLAQTKRDMVE